MIGPSSSHTAGAVAIGRAANKLFEAVPPKVTVHYYESFASTHRGHGTDYAIAAGILGFSTDDPRVPHAPAIARKMGVDIRFVEEEGQSPIHHPNTAVLEMSDNKKGKKIWLSSCSIGGGAIEIRSIVLHNVEIKPQGPLPIVIYFDYDKNHENGIPITSYLERVAPFTRKQVFKATDCHIYEYDIQNYMQSTVKHRLKEKFKTVICL